mmetsp:Transcript_26731/g.61515  ORF Transcript_26731/g.61515 Transcript_26731/m.61515 type:complete len:268 (-) Transcript_26731:110-913(-)
MRPLLVLEPSVGVSPGHADLDRPISGNLPCRGFQYFCLHPLRLGVSQIHAPEHVDPVATLRAPRARIDLYPSLRISVVPSRKHRFELVSSEILRQIPQHRFGLGQKFVRFFAVRRRLGQKGKNCLQLPLRLGPLFDPLPHGLFLRQLFENAIGLRPRSLPEFGVGRRTLQIANFCLRLGFRGESRPQVRQQDEGRGPRRFEGVQTFDGGRGRGGEETRQRSEMYARCGRERSDATVPVMLRSGRTVGGNAMAEGLTDQGHDRAWHRH